MNKKIFFDLDVVDSEQFVDKLQSVEFVSDVPYTMDIYIVPFDKQASSDMLSGFQSFPYSKYDSDLLFLISTMPFILFSSNDSKEKLKSLFLSIFMAASYAEVGSYCVGKECYYKAFCIEISRGGFVS